MELEGLLDTRFPRLDEPARSAARARQAQLTKPPGSLGRLEELAEDLAAWQARPIPTARPAAAVLFAADHPIASLGVSPYPATVTAAMVQNFLDGGAAASVLAKAQAIPLSVVDVGVETPYPGPDTPDARLVRAPRAGSVGDLVHTDALSEQALEAALRAGQTAIDALKPTPAVVVLGEMGIGNSSVASAVASSLTGEDPADWVGPGTGASGPLLERKRALVRAAVARVGRVSPAESLRRLGGRELAALVGAAARAASKRIAVLVDGFIVSSAMLALVRLRPEARPALIFAHRSAEPAHDRLLRRHLGAEPLLDLGLRLGEGSGALAAVPLLDAACSLHREMATFKEASVPDRAP